MNRYILPLVLKHFRITKREYDLQKRYEAKHARQFMCWHYYQKGLSYTEIAILTGMTYKKAYQAFRKVRGLLYIGDKVITTLINQIDYE